MSGTNLYAGGYFTTAGGVPANNIAKWNGSAWSALGSGMSTATCRHALAVSGTDLYAGGDFTTAGGVPANYIAKWNGSAWSALGSGMDGTAVYALAVSGTDLYAGGYFTTAGGVAANHIAKWDGSAWSALGSGMDTASALAVSATANPNSGDGGHGPSSVDVAGGDQTYQLFFNGTNLLSYTTVRSLELTNVNFSHSGIYTVVVTNVFGVVTSAPACST